MNLDEGFRVLWYEFIHVKWGSSTGSLRPPLLLAMTSAAHLSHAHSCPAVAVSTSAPSLTPAIARSAQPKTRVTTYNEILMAESKLRGDKFFCVEVWYVGINKSVASKLHSNKKTANRSWRRSTRQAGFFQAPGQVQVVSREESEARSLASQHTTQLYNTERNVGDGSSPPPIHHLTP